MTRRGVETRLDWHRRARNCRWLLKTNGDLAAWLAGNTAVAVPLEEVDEDGGEWQREREWIAELAHSGLLNVKNNPLRSPKPRRGRLPPPVAV